MPVRTAIVTTFRYSEAVLASFINYHFSIGFDHLFLFFDAPNAKPPPLVKNHPNITCYPRNFDLELAWESTTGFLDPTIARSIDFQIMSRQILNAELALRDAFNMKIDWLLHIDIDELFFPGETTVQNHFAAMESEGIASAHYTNLESIPESIHVNDFFKEVTLFKISPGVKSNKKAISNRWKLLSTIPQIPDSFFHYYSSGKSAVKVLASTLPKGVHYFSLPYQGVRKKISDEPAILHYPSNGLRHFLQKYKTLGDFPDKWFGKTGGGAIGFRSHLEGRDIVKTNDDQAIKSYYKDHFVVSDDEIASALIKANLCKRIEKPASILKHLHQNGGIENG